MWSEIIRVISKWNELAARGRFEITSMISDQNCTPLSSKTTLLHLFRNLTIKLFKEDFIQYQYFIDPVENKS